VAAVRATPSWSAPSADPPTELGHLGGDQRHIVIILSSLSRIRNIPVVKDVPLERKSDAPDSVRGVVVAIVLGLGLGLVVLALATRVGSAIGG
jgi:hypothetical protein